VVGSLAGENFLLSFLMFVSIDLDCCNSCSLLLGVHLVNHLFVVVARDVPLQLKGRGQQVVVNRHLLHRDVDVAGALQPRQLVLC